MHGDLKMWLGPFIFQHRRKLKTEVWIATERQFELINQVREE
jgi:hypothetical protein